MTRFSAISFLGEPTSFLNICKIFAPTVKEVVCEDRYDQYRKTLTITQEDIWDMFKDKETEDIPTPFELLMINAHYSPELMDITLGAFRFFTREEVRILTTEKLIVFIDDIENVQEVEELRLLEEKHYFNFQNAIRAACGLEIIKPPVEDEDPRVARIKAKARERDRILQKQSSKDGFSLITSLGALCCMGIGITPLNIGEITYAAAMFLMKIYQQQERYKIDMQLLAGGADSKKLKPKYWIRDLNN